MKKGQSLNFGIKGWLLIIYQVCAYSTMTVFTNYPMNILADMYGGHKHFQKFIQLA